MAQEAPAAWELNEAFLGMWNPDTDIYNWTMPDNFHVKIKVIDTVKETVHFMNEPYDVFYKVQQPVEEGRSLSANTVHSVDGMIVREITRRCDYNPQHIEYVRCIVDTADSDSGPIRENKDSEMVNILWNHYKESGFLSARILDHLNGNNIRLVDLVVIRELLDSLPKKPFKVVSIHDCFRVHPNYGNDIRRQYNNLLMLVARSSLLGYLISQITERKATIGKLHPTMWREIQHSNYALS